MKSFEEIINEDVNEGLHDKWKHQMDFGLDVNANIGAILLDMMQKLDRIETLIEKR